MRLLENYVSVQGEGPRTGTPTRFIRFAGCNLRCPGWPCDTQHAIEPELWKPVALTLSGIDLADQIDMYPKNICLTGGEPLLQRAGDLQDLIDRLQRAGHTIEMFTNGTHSIPAWMHGGVRVMMDWKLVGSGEDMSGFQSVREANIEALHPKDGIKFVVKDTNDLRQAFAVYQIYGPRTAAKFWVGAVWGQIDDASIVEFITELELPWHLNVQMHKHVWPADMQGV